MKIGEQKTEIVRIIKGSPQPVSAQDIWVILQDKIARNSIDYHLRRLEKQKVLPIRFIKKPIAPRRKNVRHYYWGEPLKEWEELGFKSEEEYDVAILEWRQWEEWSARNEIKRLKQFKKQKTK